MPKLSGARQLAVQVNRQARERQAYTADVLDAQLAKCTLLHDDRAFARVLCLGVAATVGTLDDIINRCLRSPRDIRDNVRDALRISTYEIIFLDKDPYAAVDQGVELVRFVAPPAAGLANSVLRKIVRAKASFPFGDPAIDDAALARLYGFPAWLAKALVAQMGREAAESFMKASNAPAAVFIGVNAARTDDATVRREFGREEIPLDAVRDPVTGACIPGCYRLRDARAVASHAARHFFERGGILVSDAAAQAIAALALPDAYPGEFLEVGSGRGTKTILLQSDAVRKWGNQMALTCVDSYEFKDKIVRKRAQTYGIELDAAVKADGRHLAGTAADKIFGAAFVDAPCSGLGTLRRHPEIRWRMTPTDVLKLADLGFELLEEAGRHVRVGGRLTYATCTVLAQENEVVIKRFLESETGKGFRLQPLVRGDKPLAVYRSPLIAEGCDAHFAAVLRRVE